MKKPQFNHVDPTLAHEIGTRRPLTDVERQKVEEVQKWTLKWQLTISLSQALVQGLGSSFHPEDIADKAAELASILNARMDSEHPLAPNKPLIGM